MGKGKIYRDRQVRYTDSRNGREITRLTGYLGHSWQLYFTHPCWVDGATALVLKSERENRGNYFRYELATGELVQLTDFSERQLFEGCLSPATNRLYYWLGATLWELRLDDLEERPVSEVPGPMRPTYGSQINVTADGRYVCALLMEDGVDPRAGSSELFELRPRSQLVRIDVAGGGIEVLHKDRRYITHVNTSPTRSDLLTFCHEGPWERVEQRIWGLNLDTHEVWPIRPQRRVLGNRRALVRGRRANRLSQPPAGRQRHPFRPHPLGQQRPRRGGGAGLLPPLPQPRRLAGGGRRLASLPAAEDAQQHGHLALHPAVPLGRRRLGSAAHPSVPRQHLQRQRSHPHPRFTPDGRHVLYTSDVSGYANLYLAPVGDLDDLPVLDLDTG